MIIAKAMMFTVLDIPLKTMKNLPLCNSVWEALSYYKLYACVQIPSGPGRKEEEGGEGKRKIAST